MTNFKFDLGLEVQDNITKLKGVITDRKESIHHRLSYWVQPSVDKNQKSIEGRWIDEDDIVIKSKVAKKKAKKVKEVKADGSVVAE